MSITACGPYCDVCGNLIMPIGDEMVHHFDVWGLENLIADNKCVEIVKDAAKKKDWKILPQGPLRKVWETQEAVGASGEVAPAKEGD